MSNIICNAPFCQNSRNINHGYCGKHRWERSKYKISVYKELLPIWAAKRCKTHGLIRFDQVYINPNNKSKMCLKCKIKVYYCPKKAKEYNFKYNNKRRNDRLIKHYKLNISEFQNILSKQNNGCAICGCKEGEIDPRTKKPRSLAVDHCHNSNIIRGILCYRCNVGLGFFRDNPTFLQNAFKYLDSTNNSIP